MEGGREGGRERDGEERETETEREGVLPPVAAQALSSPFEDFKNHLGPLSIFVKQVNQRATAHRIQRQRRAGVVVVVVGGHVRVGEREKDVSQMKFGHGRDGGWLTAGGGRRETGARDHLIWFESRRKRKKKKMFLLLNYAAFFDQDWRLMPDSSAAWTSH